MASGRSTISTAMVLDDHEMADDWNISRSCKAEMSRKSCQPRFAR